MLSRNYSKPEKEREDEEGEKVNPIEKKTGAAISVRGGREILCAQGERGMERE